MLHVCVFALEKHEHADYQESPTELYHGQSLTRQHMHMDQSAIEQAATILRDARINHRRIDALPEQCRPQNIDDGYCIQEELVRLMDLPVAGWKVGSTNKRAQELVGTTEPFSARLLGPNFYHHPAVLDGNAFFMRALEPEFAFRLGSDLDPANVPYSREQVLEAIETLHPAIEISDSRFNDWSAVGAASLIADNGNDGGFVLGNGIEDWRDLDLPARPVSLIVNEEVIAQGSGANVLGDPILALIWFINDRARRGDRLLAGQAITTGSCTNVVMAGESDNVKADFGDLGVVELSFQA
ncbi:MAG: 2-keto-4-pentenoate hydratase [Acidiferrobacterales bacterium]